MKTNIKSFKSKWKKNMLDEKTNVTLTEIMPILNDMELMRDEPSIEPCYDVNPELWRLFCKINKREFNANYVWSEMDVVLWIDEHTMKVDINKRIARLNDVIAVMGISRTQVSNIIGVQERTVYRWLSGDRPIPDFVFRSLHYANLLRLNGIPIDHPSYLLYSEIDEGH